MNKKGILLLIVIIAIIFSVVCSSCTPIESKDEDVYLISAITGSPNEYLYINKSGYSEYSIYTGNKLIEFYSGTLSEEDMKKLSEYVDNSGFYNLLNAYPPIIYPIFRIITFNFDYYKILIKNDNRIKSVYINVGVNRPDSFWNIQRYLYESIKPKLQDDPRYGYYAIAEKTSGEKNPKTLEEVDIKIRPFILQALINPRRPVFTSSSEEIIKEYHMSLGLKSIKVAFNDSQYRVVFIEREE